jgi:bacteriophage exclusion system BrxC/D-like protein
MTGRATIRRLRSGIVPISELERLSVGYDAIAERVTSQLVSLSRGEEIPPLFVRGEWGSGKSHFLGYVRMVADAWKIPAATVEVNARSAALNYPQRLYPLVAENLRYGEDVVGLRGLVMEWLSDVGASARLARAAENRALGPIAGAIRSLRWRYDNGDRVAFDDYGDWSTLLGADLRWADYAYKRAQALSRLGELGMLFRDLGAGGMVLIFDECETIDQLANYRSRLTAYGVFGRLCRTKPLWCIFGITDRFDLTLKTDIDRGLADSSAASDDARWFLKAWARGVIASFEPPAVDARLARDLAKRVACLYADAYGECPEGDAIVDRCMTEWTSNPSRNPRRLIRLVVDRLDTTRGIAPVPRWS